VHRSSRRTAYLPEKGAEDLFATAITSATAGVTDFELLAQSWVLVGHHALATDHSAFIAINGVTDWKMGTVRG